MKRLRTISLSMMITLASAATFMSCNDDFDEMKVQKIEEPGNPANSGDSGSGTGETPPSCSDC